MTSMLPDVSVSAEHTDPRVPQRVRYPTARRRTLTVQRIEPLAAHMTRITFTGDLLDFVSRGFDDHIKMFFPERTENSEQSANVIARDFTPRQYDLATNTLQVDFVIHESGAATQWASSQARVGESLTIGGPRGSFIIPVEYDWHLLVGDETALPAIGRRLAELPPDSRVVVIAEVDGKSDEIAFDSRADATVTWVYRNGAAAGTTDGLAKALAAQKLPSGDYYAWVACESLIAKGLRHQLLADHHANPKWTRAAGYWRRGSVGVHEVHEN
ncbi:MAG TPA: siderophore-interacting protein [Xanthobacteraceae bacterium]|nr:siderophore-interacting protein [Xanthobacteraceae bacterium]